MELSQNHFYQVTSSVTALHFNAAEEHPKLWPATGALQLPRRGGGNRHRVPPHPAHHHHLLSQNLSCRWNQSRTDTDKKCSCKKIRFCGITTHWCQAKWLCKRLAMMAASKEYFMALEHRANLRWWDHCACFWVHVEQWFELLSCFCGIPLMLICFLSYWLVYLHMCIYIYTYICSDLSIYWLWVAIK